MNEYHDIHSLIPALKKSLLSNSGIVIGIDGPDGCGKTTLASKISSILKIPYFSIDDYLIKNKGAYREYLKHDDLKNAIRNVSGPFIFEGVLLLEVAQHINIEITDLIYVKRISKYGFWYDEDICDIQQPVEEYIQMLDQEFKQLPEIHLNFEYSVKSKDTRKKGLDPFSKEIIRYHDKFKPINKAKYIYQRIDI